MNRDHIKLSQLRAFVAVAAAGNFSEAGLQLGISQSAVSHAIASLEDELGVVLFSRGRHGATLTPVGDRMLCHAHHMLNLLDDMSREASLSKGLEGGDVRIASFRSVATHVLPEVIAKFRTRFPAINVSLAECRGDDGIEIALRKGNADIGIICLPPSLEFDMWELFRDEYVVLLPPDAKASDPITWDEIAQYPLIMPPDTDYCSILIRSHFASVKQPLRAAYTINEDSTIIGMVMRGLGISVMARLAAEPLPPRIQVRRLPIPLERVIRAVTMPNALHTPAVYAFLDALKEVRNPLIVPFKQAS
ncbi:LysR family transcriptional regulator [Leptolyngbya sp. AN02str]|uniref:LysR family transcriptional regulator n=1 Tax=Leptolyngbya sp. AN02str TaxID=3423363 RepID=UPI003D312D93